VSRPARQSIAAALVGSFGEAWAEVRIHRTRVLLSLIGVAVAVAAISAVVGLGAIVQQSIQESSERNGGRSAMLMVNAYNPAGEVDAAAVSAAFDSAADRYRIRYHSVNVYGSMVAQFPHGSETVSTNAVDADYGVMHRIAIDRGRWFVEADSRLLAPGVVVNPAFWHKLGSPALSTHPTVLIHSDRDITAVVIGVSRDLYATEYPTAYVLESSYAALASTSGQDQPQPQFEAWVPPALASQLAPLIKRDMRAALGPSLQLDVNRNDYAAQGQDPLLPIKLGVGGVAGLVLFLGALGLVNISLVTVRQRIREIGIRRSFGATAGRVFFAVMMESVVATLAAGVVGVAVAIALVENPWVQSKLAQGATDLPPFPIEAALIGLAAAVGVGALAGILPALVAVRVKVIDAIRY